MYLKFELEGDIHDSLHCVPLCVRRKLDLAALKISLDGWRALTRAERLALCHLPIDGEGDRAVYREVLQGFCARAGVPLSPLGDPDASALRWNEPGVPGALRTALASLGLALADPRWRALPEEARYALLKLARPGHDLARLHAACAELGLCQGAPPALTDGPCRA